MSIRSCILVVACASFACIARAQDRGIGLAAGQQIAPGTASSIQRLDQGYEDTGPLTMSLRIEGADLRAPSGFDEVLQFTDANGNSSLARVSGNLFATFDRSVYQPTARGLLAEVPPGTVFWIGTPPDWVREPTRPTRRSPLFIDRAVPVARESGREPSRESAFGTGMASQRFVNGPNPAALPAPPSITVTAPVNRLWRNEHERTEMVRFRLRQAASQPR